MTSSQIHLCIVNRNYPPDKGATGYHAHQFAKHLGQDGRFHVSVVTTSSDNQTESYIHRIPRKYDGKKKLARLAAGSLECRALLKKAMSLQPDFYLIMTDPPQLNYWASRMLKGKQWALWTMDLYPQGYISNGLISAAHPLTRHYKKVLQKNQPNILITLGENQRQFLYPIYKSGITSVNLPIGLIEINETRNDIPVWYAEGQTHIGYIGNLGEAHDSEKIYTIANGLDYSKYRLVISCDGAKANEVVVRLEKNENVILLDYLPDRYMGLIDIEIVLSSSAWTHICVPSKALSAIQHGSSVYFLGDKESDTWEYVMDCGWRQKEDDITSFFTSLSKEEITTKKNQTSQVVKDLQEKLQKGWDEIANLISLSVSE